jgi:adenylyl-sulfate kinase
MHCAHLELTFRAAKQAEVNLLIHLVVGMTKPGDVDYYTRVRCYQLLSSKYPQGTQKLSLLPLVMLIGGPREAIWHSLIRKNHGCTHLIVGRDHAGPGKATDGKAFYGPYEAQGLFRKHESEIGVTMVPFSMMVYFEGGDRYVPDDEVKKTDCVLNTSDTELRQRLNEGREILGWFTYPEVVHELRRSFPPRSLQGVTVFFTGLSGSGKSTIANALLTKFLEVGGRPVTLLDGDLVCKHLSSELGFSKGHRDINIPRIGYVASEITKDSSIAICAPIAPYDARGKHVRQMLEPYGGFILVHVATPLEICEQRDRKGLYTKARAGILKEFTGISDPYEVPTGAEVTTNTSELSPEEAAQEITLHLEREGFIGVNGLPRKTEPTDYATTDSQNSGWLYRRHSHRHERRGRGGVFLLPALIFGLRVPAIVAVGSDTLFNFFTTIPVSLLHLKKGTVRRKVAIALACGSVPGSLCAVKLLAHVRHHYRDGVNNFIKTAVGVLLIVIPTLLLLQRRAEEHMANRAPTTKGFTRMALIGVVAGFLIGMISVGSGSIIMVLLFMFYSFPPKIKVGTDIVHAVVLTGVTGLLHFGFGNVDPSLVLSLLMGSIPGGLLGSHLTTRMPMLWLRRIPLQNCC